MMNRLLALLAAALAPLFFGACSPDDSIADLPTHPVPISADETAPLTDDASNLAAWPRGVAP